MKKSVLTIVIIAFLLCLPCGVSANTENNINDTGIDPTTSVDTVSHKDTDTMVINESEIFNDLKKISDAQLAKKGYSQQEIDTIKNNSYVDLIRERGKLPDNELSNMGYTTEEIAILKDTDATDAQLMCANINNFTATSKIEKFLYESDVNYTYAAVYMSWQWSKTPFCCFKDVIVFAWRQDMTFMPYSENNKCRYTLYSRNTMTGASRMTTTGFTDNDRVNFNAVKTSHNLLTAATTPPTAKMFCYRGAARVIMKCQGNMPHLETLCSYAHYASLENTYISIGIGPFSIGYNPDTQYKEQLYCDTDTQFDWR